MVLVGKKAPKFSTKAVINGGEIVDGFSLEQFIGKKHVLFFFYPKDFTFVCPSELHAFQAKLEDFKKKGVDKVSKQFQAELNDLQQKIKSFVSLAKDTQQVYSARFKFEPIVGETYHLYQGKKEAFLSLIPPNQWKKEHLGTFLLNGDYKWERL